MQFAVPQFTDVEDKLLGPLTLKQFLSLLATGGIILFFWSLLRFSFAFFLFAGPFALLGIIITFGSFNGRQFYAYLGPMLDFIAQPKTMIYRREGIHLSNARKAPKPKLEIRNSKFETSESSESRLKKLAYLLDQKTHEEEELIEHVTRTT